QERHQHRLSQILGRYRLQCLGQAAWRVDVALKAFDQGLHEVGNDSLADRRLAEMPTAPLTPNFESIPSGVSPPQKGSLHCVGKWHAGRPMFGHRISNVAPGGREPSFLIAGTCPDIFLAAAIASAADREPAATSTLASFKPIGFLSPFHPSCVLQNRSSSFPYASQFRARCMAHQLNQWLIAQHRLSTKQ